jgi:hypothetical protein
VRVLGAGYTGSGAVLLEGLRSSILLLDTETDELVFEAAADEASESLIGKRFPSSTGIAGFVLVSRQPW